MKYFVVDVFTDKLFGGNPAGVCLLEGNVADDVMQSIAFENNLSETAFVRRVEDEYELRWFTPETEIDLCGHATLAAAFVLMTQAGYDAETVRFHTASGVLTVRRNGDRYDLDFPSRPAIPCAVPPVLEQALGVRVIEAHFSRDMLAVVESEAVLRTVKPDMALLRQVEGYGVIVTAKGEHTDFVSRFFAPKAGIDEDPVTGSSHCTLIPYWRERLGKTEMTAAQLSQRGGLLYCTHAGERVIICGTAVLYLKGNIETIGL